MAAEGDLIGPGEIDEQLNLLEAIKSAIGVDDDFLAAMLGNQLQMARMERQQAALLQQLVDINRAITPEGEIILPNSFPFEFSTDVTADTQPANPITTSRGVPFDGRIRTLFVGWPDGANNAVGVQFRTESGERFFPRNKQDDYIAANDFTHAFDLRAPVDKDDTLVAQFINTDTTNNHFINVVATIEVRSDRVDAGEVME